jgi:hypothetical protein
MVAMPVVGMVEVPIDEIIRVVSVRDRLMTAIGSVDVVVGVACATVVRGAGRGIAGRDRERVLVTVAFVGVVEVPGVEVVDVTIVNEGRMAAVGAVRVVVVVGFVPGVRHRSSPGSVLLSKCSSAWESPARMRAATWSSWRA